MALVVICPKQEGVTHQSRMEGVLHRVLAKEHVRWITHTQQLEALKGQTILFAVQLNF